MFEWEAFLTLAEELSENKDEAKQRSAIIRAYYAAFHKAKMYLAGKGLEYMSQKNAHAAVWNAFSMLDDELRKIAVDGDRLKRKRQKADYDGEEIRSLSHMTTDAIKTANRIITGLNKETKGKMPVAP